MKNILVLSQKGGTGKTTLADNIAYMLEDEGYSVTFYDTDPQGGSLHGTVKHDDPDVAVIDTPGILTDNTRDMIEDADVIVVPTRASRLDMQPLQRIRDMIEKDAPSVPVLIVLNGFNRWSNANDFKEWLESKLRHNESLAVLSQSEMIPQAAGNDISVVSYAPKSRPAEELRQIVQSVKDLLGLEGV